MTSDHRDRDLAERFAALRALDLAEAPAFDVVWTKAVARASSKSAVAVPARAWMALCGAAVLGLGLWLAVGALNGSRDADPAALPGWRTPTDSLMAGAGDALHGPSWASLPTTGLGPSLPLDPSRENR